jgi:hypothetical protein
MASMSLDNETVEVPNNMKHAFSIAFTAIIIVFTCPIAIADIVYGARNDECLNEYPDSLHLNMKKYLIVSGVMTLVTGLYMIVNVCYILENNKITIAMMVLNLIFMMLMSIFSVIWNILGAIVFWKFIYPEGQCNEDVSSYLFASLVIKLVFTYMNMISAINRKDDD